MQEDQIKTAFITMSPKDSIIHLLVLGLKQTLLFNSEIFPLLCVTTS